MANMTRISTPQETFTINQFIDLKDADMITYQKYSVLERSKTNSSLVYAIDNIIYTYMDEMEARRKIVSVTMEDKVKYIYKPKLLSYDIYGSVETYFILLAMNGMCNAKEFNLADDYFYALTPQDLSYFMNNIYNAETEHLILNRTNLQIYES